LESNVKSLETARLRLVPLAAEDFEPLYAVYSEPEVSRHLLTQPRSRDEFRRPFEQMLESSSTLGMWMIVDKADNRSIGRCGFYPFSEPPVGTPELAYLLSRAYWSRGLATEAALCCLDFAFRTQGWPEVVAMVRPENALSARVLSKIGMQLLRRITVRGIPADLYQISSASYAPTGRASVGAGR